MKAAMDNSRGASTSGKQRATSRAQARTRQQIMRPGSVAESGTLGYSLAKLAGSIFSRSAPAAAQAAVKKAPSMAQKAARKQITLVPVKGRGSYGPGKLQQNAGKYPANPTAGQKGSLTKSANKRAAAAVAKNTTPAKTAAARKANSTAVSGRGAGAAAGAAAAGVAAGIASKNKSSKPTSTLSNNSYKAKKPIKITYSSGKAPVRKKG